jgi:hypothetical protein
MVTKSARTLVAVKTIFSNINQPRRLGRREGKEFRGGREFSGGTGICPRDMLIMRSGETSSLTICRRMADG